jgi:Zinc-binding loop region of homing endonuclease
MLHTTTATLELAKTEMHEAFNQALDYCVKRGAISDEVSNQAKRGDYPTMKCFPSAYKPTTNGYTQVRYKSRKYYLHIIAAAIAGRPTPIDGKTEGSHCCPLKEPDRTCFNPAHIAVEDGLTNKSRLCCQLFRDVSNYRCPHRDPPCWGVASCYESNSQLDYWHSSQ